MNPWPRLERGGSAIADAKPRLGPLDGLALVVSPLISLMKDQVDAAVATGLRAAFLNSSMSLAAKQQVETEFAAGQLDLIYVSPERFAMPDFIATLKQAR